MGFFDFLKKGPARITTDKTPEELHIPPPESMGRVEGQINPKGFEFGKNSEEMNLGDLEDVPRPLIRQTEEGRKIASIDDLHVPLPGKKGEKREEAEEMKEINLSGELSLGKLEEEHMPQFPEMPKEGSDEIGEEKDFDLETEKFGEELPKFDFKMPEENLAQQAAEEKKKFMPMAPIETTEVFRGIPAAKEEAPSELPGLELPKTTQTALPGARPSAEFKNFIYLDADHFFHIRSSISDIKAQLKKSLHDEEKVNHIKNSEDSALNEYKSLLENMQRKLLYVDKILFEKQSAE